MGIHDAERIAKLETTQSSVKEDIADLKTDIKELHSRITTGQREIVDKLEDLDKTMLDRMTTNSATSTRQHQLLEKEIKESIIVLAARITDLEKWKWYVVGAAMTVGYLISIVDPIAKLLK